MLQAFKIILLCAILLPVAVSKQLVCWPCEQSVCRSFVNLLKARGCVQGQQSRKYLPAHICCSVAAGIWSLGEGRNHVSKVGGGPRCRRHWASLTKTSTARCRRRGGVIPLLQPTKRSMERRRLPSRVRGWASTEVEFCTIWMLAFDNRLVALIALNFHSKQWLSVIFKNYF